MAATTSSRIMPIVPLKMPGRCSARNSASQAMTDQPATTAISMAII